MTNQHKSKKETNFFKKVVRSLDSVQFGGGKERDYLLENMSMLVGGGMTVLAAISAVEGEIRSRSMKRAVAGMRHDIENGSPVWQAFLRSKLFGDHSISLIRVGEESGKLSQNLKLIAAQEAKSRSFRSKIRSAMMYPVFVLSLTAIMGVLIAWFILPRLAIIFSQLKVELPRVTEILIQVGTFLGEYGQIFFPIFFLVFGLLVYFVFYFSKTKFIGQTILFSLPGITQVIQEVELARFGYLLGTLLRAGLPVTHAIDSLEKAATFPQYKKLYRHLRHDIDEGHSFQRSFARYKKLRPLMPTPVQQLIVAGEQSGNLSDSLLKISEIFEAKTEQTTKNISVILEPVLLVVVWLGVVGVALAVILPIYSLIGGFNVNSSQSPVVDTPRAAPSEVVPDVSIIEIEPTPLLEITADDDIEYLNVRDTASIEADIIYKVFPGEIYEYTDENEEWYEILLPEDEVGWVSQEYVSVIKTE